MRHLLWEFAGALYFELTQDGQRVFSVGCDKAGRMLDLNTNQSTQVAAHDAPIKSCRYIDGIPNMNNMLVTGSWDKTAKVFLFNFTSTGICARQQLHTPWLYLIVVIRWI